MASPKVAAAAGFILALAFASSSATAFKFNVTEILDEFPEFSVFNGLLSRTKLADEINHRQTVTVLVVDDPAAGAITSLPANTQRKVLAVQVLLDYYDPVKLDGVKEKTALLATLLQAANGGRTGLVNYTQGDDDQMAFGSAEPGAPITSQLVKVVASRPYNLSVMQVSAPVVPPSLGSSSGKGSNGAPLSSPATANGSTPSPAPTKKAETSEASAPASGTDTATALSDYDDDPIASATVDTPSAAAEGPESVDTPTRSPSNETSFTADVAPDGTTTSAGSSRVMVGASIGLMAGLLMLISISC
ncbi:hypothetical protein E2562_017332 [Oryza meyeriana var. granulata]|uniref:FAS1 domain-containing protein n=1 Tax=Oryza meyeriana var. granulata TaxID=110450 RepID=A0A6G1BZ07_9ORYZ|nr:hypothetical protein E2562_017332 [Oryza meyeriana var. granulata]